MKTTALILGAALLAGAAPLAAQETRKSANRAEATERSLEQLIEELGDSDYEVRKAAEASLRGRGKAALEILKKTAEKHDDPEVQWRAGRLVRQIESGAAKRPRLGKRDAGKGDTGKGDVARPPARGEDRSRAADALRELDKIFDGGDFDADVQRQIDKAMERMRQSLKEFDGFDNFGHGFDVRIPRLRLDGLRNGSSSKSTKISRGPDGVRVEVTEKGEDGKDETKVYEAEDMESFKKKYPDVLDSHGVRIEMGELFGGEPFRVLSPRLFRDGQPLLRDLPRRRSRELPKGLRKKTDAGGGDEVQSEGRKLGFYIGQISPAVRDYLELDGGLMVESVVEGSLAEKLGVKKGDIVVRVGEKDVRTAEDVAASLEAIGDGKVTVDVIRRGRKVALR